MKKLILLALLSSCTISFQNITTDGNASDIIDETQDISPTLDTNLSIPKPKVKPIENAEIPKKSGFQMDKEYVDLPPLKKKKSFK